MAHVDAQQTWSNP